VVIATHLRPEEAGMLRGLLESAGVRAAVRDELLSAVHPFLQPAIGGVKLAVRAADEERARDIVRSSGVLPGSQPYEVVEIPEEEWSRAAPQQGSQDAASDSESQGWAGRVLAWFRSR
jgi:hypothetical protein